MLTISELARFAGVTVRAVRHYHARGLLAEPPRDASGYRRYDAQAVIDLLRIRTLAEAGVPLSRVSDLLRADSEAFAAALVEIDRDLRQEVRRLQRHRSAIALLASGESLALPGEVTAYLNRLRELGLSERVIRIERDGWVLLTARAPHRVPVWIGMKLAALDDPGYLSLYLGFSKVLDLEPDDPWLETFADELAEFLTEVYDGPEATEEDVAALDGMTVNLLDSRVMTSSPTLGRLHELLADRGWTGWTEVGPEDHR